MSEEDLALFKKFAHAKHVLLEGVSDEMYYAIEAMTQAYGLLITFHLAHNKKSHKAAIEAYIDKMKTT
jgi:hypothetical protein